MNVGNFIDYIDFIDNISQQVILIYYQYRNGVKRQHNLHQSASKYSLVISLNYEYFSDFSVFGLVANITKQSLSKKCNAKNKKIKIIKHSRWQSAWSTTLGDELTDDIYDFPKRLSHLSIWLMMTALVKVIMENIKDKQFWCLVIKSNGRIKDIRKKSKWFCRSS